MNRQRDLFLTSEGDAWFTRNEAATSARDWSRDPVCVKLAALSGKPLRVLEIGCGSGLRLEYLAKHYNHDVYGVDPSKRAVMRAIERGAEAVVSTAETLPYPDGAFDVVIFGFCLYLCDDKDLFRIGLEADRVLANPGWMLILDFESPAPVYKPYHHLPGVKSRKMDYKLMFLWHPAYTLASHEKFHHGNQQWTDDPDEWVSLACLRKCLAT